MIRYRLPRRARQALWRLSEPSSAAGLAALLAMIAPDLTEEAPVIVELTLVVLAAGAGLWAIVRGESNGTNGQ